MSEKTFIEYSPEAALIQSLQDATTDQLRNAVNDLRKDGGHPGPRLPMIRPRVEVLKEITEYMRYVYLHSVAKSLIEKHIPTTFSTMDESATMARRVADYLRKKRVYRFEDCIEIRSADIASAPGIGRSAVQDFDAYWMIRSRA